MDAKQSAITVTQPITVPEATPAPAPPELESSSPIHTLDRILAQERAEVFQKYTANTAHPHVPAALMVSALSVLMVIAMVTLLSTMSLMNQADIASNLQNIPFFSPSASAFPVQPDVNTRQLKPVNVNQLGDSLRLDGTSGVSLRGAEVTQGIQVFNEPENPRCNLDPTQADYIFCNNSIPLVARRHTMLRVYLTCDGQCPFNDSTVRLRVLKDGLERDRQVYHLSALKLAQLSNLPLTQLQLSLDNSINFQFRSQPAWLSGDVTFEVSVTPATLLPEAQTEPEILVELPHTFTPRKSLRIAYLPIQYQGQIPGELENVSYWLTRMFPVAEVDYYRLPVPDLVWEGELNKNQILQKLLYTYWLYAIYHPPSEWPDQLFGWLPKEVYNGGASDPYWCPYCAGPHSSRVGFGGLRPELDIGGPRILVHELAHNLGAQHAWSPTQTEDSACFRGEGVDIQVDPTWPYAETASIQQVGVDLYSDPPIVYSTAHYDMMAYCAQPWISPYTYRTIFNSPFLNPYATTTLPMSDYQPQLETSGSGALLISGVVYPDGTVADPEIIQLDGDTASMMATAFSPPSEGDYCVQVQNEQNQQIGKQCFEVGFMDIETGLSTDSASSFFVTLPNISAEQADQVLVKKGDDLLLQLNASNSTPQISLISPTGGETLDGQQTIRWQSSDADGDSLFYDVLYSPDDGQSWLPLAVRLTDNKFTFHTRQLPPSEQGRIRVTVSDGFHNNMAETDDRLSLNLRLENSISLHGPMDVTTGDSFTVKIMANGVADTGLAQADFTLNFDPETFQIERVKLHPELALNSQERIANSSGQMIVKTGSTRRPHQLSGDVVLATVYLTAVEPASSTQLYLTDFSVQTGLNQPLEVVDIWELTLQVR
ncbi:cohesin domain-containing protein [Anaerolineales bacterium HSG25]|nr:cohesin domain-containing protein [Anaerolineales bacterium HSG25]